MSKQSTAEKDLSNTKTYGYVKMIFALTTAICLSGCYKATDSKETQHYSEGIFQQADSLSHFRNSETVIQLIDSIYATFPVISITDRYRYYQFRATLSEAHNSPSQKTDSSLLYTDSMISLIEENNKTKEMAKEYASAFRLKCEYCMFRHRYKEAFDAVSMSRYITRQSGDSCNSAENTAMLGNIAYQQSKFLEAANNFKDAVSLFSYCPANKDQFYRMQGNLDNIGVSYAKAGQPDSALKYYKIAEQYIEQNKHLYNDDQRFPYIALTVVYSNMAELLRQQNNYTSAEEYLQKNITIYRKNIADSIEVAECQVQLAELYWQMGRVEQASVLLQQTKKQYLLMNGPDNKLKWLKLAAEIAGTRKEKKQKLEFIRQYYSLKDSVAEKDKEILGYDPAAQYDQLEKKYEVELLEKNNRLQRTYTIAAIFVTLLSLTLALVIFFSLKHSRKLIRMQDELNNGLIKREQQLEQLMEERELSRKKEKEDELFHQEIKLQVQHNEAMIAQRKKISDDIHDELSASLAALRYYVSDIKSRHTGTGMEPLLGEIEGEVNSIYKNTRQYMHDLKTNTRNSMHSLGHFLTDVSKKFKDKELLSISFDVNDELLLSELTYKQYNQLNYIIREAISNCIKHAAATALDIRIFIDDNKCHFIIKDNGKGFNREKGTYGIGLNSIESRIIKLNGDFSITPEHTGTVIQGSFPVV